MIQIYCGTGKGKTTAALGLTMRAAGAGMRVLFVQFLKGGETSELASLARLPEVTVRRCDRNYGFIPRMREMERVGCTACHNRLLAGVAEAMQQHTADLIVLDELFAAYNADLLDRVAAEKLVQACPPEIELVMTGREPAACFTDAADYISEIQAVRHPFEKGIYARKGIEY
ncbi:MAG: cob(I)yrinic acid a,c-diamide adenosyltransferase [Oscillospiraceae bacterium]|nr:cob(I)yrinic acid a,c-diamide adenosyltransferase [Oscillospiraceae bacterium]